MYISQKHFGFTILGLNLKMEELFEWATFDLCNWRQTEPSIKNHYDYHHLLRNSLYIVQNGILYFYLLPVIRVYFVQSEKTRANGESLNDH